MIELTMTVIATGNTGTGHKKYIYLRSIKQEINFSCYDCRYRKFKAQARSYLTSTPAICSSFHLTANVSNSFRVTNKVLRARRVYVSKNRQTCCENKKKNITKNVREQEANVTAV